jgi:hypothetical protein
MVSKESGMLQIPYKDYQALMGKVQEGERLRQARDQVVASLAGFVNDGHVDAIATKIAAAIGTPKGKPAKKPVPSMPAPEKKVSVEFDAGNVEEPAPTPAEPAATGRASSEGVDVPPIKKDISVHFNKLDESGRLFSVFKQYYTCLNDSCGGTVRVTMKDGFCSLWNYDEWEEFAFIDIFEGSLRIAVDPRYTDALQSLNFCEVPRLLSSRRSLVCVKVDDLSNTMLGVLTRAFQEVGLTAS